MHWKTNLLASKLLVCCVNLNTKTRLTSFLPPQVTHSQLLEGLKCESQTENNGRVRSQGTLPSLQHFGGVVTRSQVPY
jgi:hypothetical protein